MATTTMPFNRTPPSALVNLLMVVALLISVPIIWSAHAIQKHTEARAIHLCIQDPNAEKVFFKTPDDTWYILCQLNPDRWGISVMVRGVYDLYHELTSFGKMQLDKALAHMLRVAAERWPGPPPFPLE